MILFRLQCGQEHLFEAWFRDGATYDSQSESGEVSCPFCAGTDITKAPMAPRIGKARSSGGSTEPDSGSKTTDGDPQSPPLPTQGGAKPAKTVMSPQMREMARLRAAMLTMKKIVEDNCDYVGPKFAVEARRIHQGQSKSRPIYGEATEAEAEAMEEEGLPVGRIPWPSASDA